MSRISVYSSFVSRELTSPDDPWVCRERADIYTFPAVKSSKYVLGLAGSSRCVEEALRLRYRIFNLELGEGLQSSADTGVDRDCFDEQMSHLVLLDRNSGEMVGTYRMQTARRAFEVKGIYSAREYDLSPLEPCYNGLIELGRACLAAGHRTLAAVLHMWQGIASYVLMNDCRYLVGCISITSNNPDDGWRAMETIRSRGYLHPEIFLRARPEYGCGPAPREENECPGESIALPPLFRAYARMGAKVISEPALGREFGTVDFLMFLDGFEVKKSTLDVLTRNRAS
ncbi:MAG TPA: GNAT family N-acyltransferase [Acidobacteriota bacterium]|nr:GNAT family N-acyltransferase [Acidobacteriota bacterium]